MQQALLPASLSIVQDNTETYFFCGVSGDHQVIPRNEPGILMFSRELSGLVLLFFQPFLCRREKELRQYIFDRQSIFFSSLKQIGRSWCQTLAKKPPFDMFQAYNISAPKTNLLESSYPLFLASQLQVTCRSRHFRTSLEGKQNVTWSAFQWLLCETCGCCLVTPSRCASKSVAVWWAACRVLEISIFRLSFLSYLHLPCADFQVTSRFLTCSSSQKRGLSL